MFFAPERLEFVAVVIGDHGGLAGLPTGRADLSVLVRELEGLDESEDLINISSDGKIVHGVLTEGSLGVDDVGSSEGDSSIPAILNEAAVVSGDLFGHIGDHGDLHLTETSLLSRLVSIFSMAKVGINGASNNLGVDGLELGGGIGELADLSGAHKGEVKRPEEQDNVLS